MTRCLRCGADSSWIEGNAPKRSSDEETRVLRAALASLVRSVEGYLDHPGCNNPAKATAMRKLRWAMDEAKKKL